MRHGSRRRGSGRRVRGPVAAAVGAGLALALAGCSAEQAPGAAALDADGDVVASVSQVQDLAAELTAEGGEQRPSELLVLQYLIVGDAVRDAVRAADDPAVPLLSAPSVQRLATDQGLTISLEAAEVAATQQMYRALVTAGADEDLQQRIADLDPTVNPRYGGWDPTTSSPLLLVEEPLPWIATATGDGAAEEDAGE